jgi:hypothetical protein
MSLGLGPRILRHSVYVLRKDKMCQELKSAPIQVEDIGGKGTHDFETNSSRIGGR